MLSWGRREAALRGRHEAGRIWPRRDRRAAPHSLRTASAQPRDRLVPASEARSAGCERTLERRETCRTEPDEGANGRQKRIFDSQTSWIVCETKILLCHTSWITSDTIQLVWHTSGLDWQTSGLVSDTTALVWQTKLLVWQTSGIVFETGGIMSDTSEVL